MVYFVKARLYLFNFFLKSLFEQIPSLFSWFLKYGNYRKRANFLIFIFVRKKNINNMRTMSDLTSISSLLLHDHSTLWAKSKYWNMAAFQNNRKIINELDKCAKKLTKVVDEIRGNGGNAIFAPLHMESDYLATLIAAFVNPRHATIVTINDNYQTNKHDTRKMLNKRIMIDRFDIGTKKTSSNLSINEVLTKARSNATNLVIFPDALPELTNRFTNQPMKTRDVTLFGKTAKIHSGIEVLALKMRATIVCYYLFDNGNYIDIHIETIVDCKKNKNLMPSIIESAIKRHPCSWLLWHSPSFYFYNQ